MVYESVVDEAHGGIGLFCVLFFFSPASFKLMVDIMPRRSASQKRAGLAWRMVTWSGWSIQQALEEFC
jgi:hypothetical protein